MLQLRRLWLFFSEFSHVTTVVFNRSAKKIVAAYRAALRPRLLVLVALVGAAAAYSSLAPQPLNGLQASALLGGFLTYKAGQFVSIRFLSCCSSPQPLNGLQARALLAGFLTYNAGQLVRF